jgi:hypothetical protein
MYLDEIALEFAVVDCSPADSPLPKGTREFVPA